ncbi:hypothetical protein GI584_14345 [Gracilibacillus salitolerans]|uniref:Restriction endonuclease type IV Mrr domain-containing protein n=1 Tax=Gracilibacillus salitolerans TaxID=2663022 RepID=A0A5Q2TM40_9BACI|nr:restriction endonuclease [Gracilibacillus salitolerans]QGH35152.1 hypothetical protein GI584_14345 [Gracilibacillus salitolerans]
MSSLNMEEYTKLQDLLARCEDNELDHIFWPILDNEDGSLQKFKKLRSKVEESKTWKKGLNWKKGRVLEDLAVFLFERFDVIEDVKKNKRTADNETDIETTFSSKALPPFIKINIGSKIVCECKNYKSKSIDVGMVTKLSEIIPDRNAKFGVFISILGMGGYGWRYGEGKRKKIMYSEKRPIISFTLDELKTLEEGSNFYTMIQQKYKLLVDDVDDESADLPGEENIEYTKRLHETINHLHKCDLINTDQYSEIIGKALERYGPIDED